MEHGAESKPYNKKNIPLLVIHIPKPGIFRIRGLRGRYEGKYSIRINDQYRIVFRFVESDAYEVEITDYH